MNILRACKCTHVTLRAGANSHSDAISFTNTHSHCVSLIILIWYRIKNDRQRDMPHRWIN